MSGQEKPPILAGKKKVDSTEKKETKLQTVSEGREVWKRWRQLGKWSAYV